MQKSMDVTPQEVKATVRMLCLLMMIKTGTQSDQMPSPDRPAARPGGVTPL